MKNNLESLKGLTATSREEMIEKVKEFCANNGYEFNWYDFDYDRIYKAGYEDLKEWEDAYVASIGYEEDEENEIITITDIIEFVDNH